VLACMQWGRVSQAIPSPILKVLQGLPSRVPAAGPCCCCIGVETCDWTLAAALLTAP
jgi:hypothetical protein